MTIRSRVFLHYLLCLFLQLIKLVFLVFLAQSIFLLIITTIYLSSFHFATFQNVFVGAFVLFESLLLFVFLFAAKKVFSTSLKRFVFIFESENKDLIRNELSAYLFPAVLKSSEIAQEYRLRLEKSLESRFKQVKFGSLFPFQYLLVSIFSIIILLLPQFQNFVKDTHQWIAFYSFLYPSSSHLKFELVDFKKAYLKNQSLDLKIAIDGVPLFPVQIKVSDEKGIVLEDLVASEFIQLAKDQFHLKIDLKGFSKKVYLQCFSGSDQSKMYLLNMVDFPRVTKSEYRLDYPAYLQKKSKTLAYLPKKILFGSDFVEKLFFNKKMEKVKTSNTAGKLLKKSDVYHLQFHMDKNLEYQIDFQDSDGFSSKSRKRMIAIKKDELPSIKVLKPISPKKIPAGILDRLPIKLKINDDFLVEKVQIEITSRQRFEMTYMSSQELIDIPIESSSHLLIETSLELSSLYLQEGDKVKFIIKAWDQLKSRGPAYSITGILYVPYMFEEAQESEENAQEVMEDLQKIAQEQKIQEAALKKLSEKKDSYQAVSAVDQKKLKDLLKKQKKLQQKANEIDKKISETLENDREKNLLDEESLRKLEQIKDIYQDLMSQMDRNMMQMNQSMKDLSQKKMNSMMKKFDSKKYSEELERTLAALKKVQAKRKLQTNLKRIEQLQKEHQQLQKSLEKNSGDLSKAAKELEKKWEEIKKSLKDLEKNSSLDASLKEDLKKKSKEMQALSKSYQKMSKNLQKNENKQSQEQNKKISEALEKMKKDLQESMQKAQEEEMRVDLEKLNQFLKESNAQSKFLMAIRDQISFYRGLQRKRYAAQEFSFLRSSAQHLQNEMYKEYQQNLSFSKTCIVISKLLQEQIVKAVKDYESDSPPRNAKPIYDAYATNNQQTLLLLSLKEQLQKQKQQSQMQQFMDSLEKLSNDQKDLNQKTQKMGQSMSQRSQYEQEQMREQMSFQQELIRKSTEQLYESYQKKLKMAKKLKSIAKEMKDVEDGIRKNDLQKGSKTEKKQNKIEYKLLEMQNAMKEQKESKKRKAKSSKKQGTQEGLDSDQIFQKTSVNIYRDLEIPQRFKGLIQGYFQSIDQK